MSMMRNISKIANEISDKYLGKEDEGKDPETKLSNEPPTFPPEPKLTAADDNPDSYLLGVDYDEFKPETYRGVVLTRGTEEVKRWNEKGYNQDWVDATNWCGQKDISPMMLSSSVHSYNQDVAKKRSA